MGVPTILIEKVAGLQVCVPKEYTDEQVVEFANASTPTGLDHGWSIRKEGHKDLQGDPERVQCEEDPTMVHVTLEC